MLTLFLFTILIVVLSYSIYGITKGKSGKTQDTNAYNSPITIENFEKNTKTKYTKEVTYLNERDDSFAFGLSEANLVFEYLNTKNRTSYKAIFHNPLPKKVHPVLDVSYKSTQSIPTLPFLEEEEWTAPNSKDAAVIFVAFTPSCFSNFIYVNGQYTHFKDTFEDIDKNNNDPIQVTNIIVQFIENNIPRPTPGTVIDPNKILGEGSGLVFSAGKAMPFKWTKEKSSDIKLTDESGNPISVSLGHTWWILIDKNASVAFN